MSTPKVWMDVEASSLTEKASSIKQTEINAYKGDFLLKLVIVETEQLEQQYF